MSTLKLHAPAFSIRFDTHETLRASSWTNHLRNSTLDFDGAAEIGVELDTARRRVWLEGWNQQFGGREAGDADLDPGFRAGYHRPEYPDIEEGWRCSPNMGMLLDMVLEEPAYWLWARSRFVLPEELRGEPVTLVLGGFGLGDARHTRFFLNGEMIGERRFSGLAAEPWRCRIEPDSPAYRALRWGQVNVLALQLGDLVTRTPHLEEFDPEHTYTLSFQTVLAPDFFQHLEIGAEPAQSLTFRVTGSENTEAGLRVALAAREAGLTAEILYQLSDDGRSLRKKTTLRNAGSVPLRLNRVELGDYTCEKGFSGGGRGFPAYREEGFFISLRHPAGRSCCCGNRLRLLQFPGRELAPGESFETMEAVLGAAGDEGATAAFREHLILQMRRTRRGHQRFYSIVEFFGSWPIPDTQQLDLGLSEEICLAQAQRLKELQQQTGAHFDLVSVDYWHDPAADLLRFSRRFPEGFGRSREAFREAGMGYGLWIDSSCLLSRWNIGLNPLLRDCATGNPAYFHFKQDPLSGGWNPLCRAAEPFRTLMKNAFLRHLTAEGCSMLKFDNLVPVCHHQHHGHWPGVYSTEAIYDSVIDFLRTLDEAAPEALFMLYWGYASPWWLLYGDTLFESGLSMEAASPSPTPSLYARDGVSVSLDQSNEYCTDIPPCGKDTLGVWLSRWPWNSSIGKGRWQEAVILDLCRGSMLFQLWLGQDPLTPAEENDLAMLLRLTRECAASFAVSKRLGSARGNGRYGYRCGDGKRVFVAVNNFSWTDWSVDIAAFAGIPAGTIYRYYPAPARLTGSCDGLRPFAVALYEIVPAGALPALTLAYSNPPAFSGFSAVTTELAVAAAPGNPRRITGLVPAGAGGMLVITASQARRGGQVRQPNFGSHFQVALEIGGEDVPAEPILAAKSYPSDWQGWRAIVPSLPREVRFTLSVATTLPEDAELEFSARFLPGAN